MITSRGHYDGYSSSPLMEKHITEGFSKPESLGTVSITSETLLDLKGDFNVYLDEMHAKQEAAREAWEKDVMRCFGFYPYMDGDLWDDDDYDDYYDQQYYGRDWGTDVPRETKDERAKRIFEYQKKQPINNTMANIRSQRFINGIEVDPDISDDDALAMIMGGEPRNTRHHKTRRGGKKQSRKRYTGGTVSRGKREFYNEWDGVIEDPAEDELPFEVDPGNDCQLDRYYDDLEADKKIIVYRYLNNTADTYEFNSAHEFSDWLDENGVIVNDDDAYEIMYRDTTHCAFDPQTSDKRLVCAGSYDDLVWYITGGDAEYLAEVSARSCPV